MSEWKEKMKRASKFEFPYQYEIIFCLLCVISAVMFRPNELLLKPYNAYVYCINYFEDGFLAKGLIGTVITELFGRMSEQSFYIMYTVVLVVLLCLFVFFLGETVRIRKKENELFMVYLGSLLCLAPCSITLYIGTEMFGSQEAFLMICFLVSMLLLYKKWGYAALPVIELVAVLIDQRYALVFLPAVLVLFYYQLKNGGQGGKQARKEKLFYLTAAGALLLSALLTFVFKSHEKDASVFYQNLMDRTGISLTGDAQSIKHALYMIQVNYFGNVGEWLKFRTMTDSDYYIFAITVLLCLPLILFLIWIWVSFIRNSHNKKLACLFPLTAFFLAPMFIFGSDYGWNLIHLLFAQFIMIVSLIGMQDGAMLAATGGIREKFHKRQWLFWLLPVYLLLIGDIDGQGITIAYLIRNLF